MNEKNKKYAFTLTIIHPKYGRVLAGPQIRILSGEWYVCGYWGKQAIYANVPLSECSEVVFDSEGIPYSDSPDTSEEFNLTEVLSI